MTTLRFVFVSAGLVLALWSGSNAAESPFRVEKKVPESDGVGSPSVFLKNYEAFKTNQLGSKNPDTVTILLGQVGNHARSFIGPSGFVSIDLQTGKYALRLDGLVKGASYDVSVIDENDTADPGDDRAFLITSLFASDESAKAEGQFDDSILSFTIDKIMVRTEERNLPKVVASGAIDVLQKLFFGSLNLTVEGKRVADGALAIRALPFASLVPQALDGEDAVKDPASAPENKRPIFGPPIIILPPPTPIDQLIKKGASLFFKETFGGNGRTCGTCHPAHNNFTVDPSFISTLPSTDPLFVAETVPALALLEKPALMRAFGLILENLDGLEAPPSKFVMRSVPHTLGMTVSLTRDTLLPNAPAQMTGWAGDGAPGSGSLRDFATGAVTQHFTRRLIRTPGIDFIPPTQRQLDAIEAFQLSLGRTSDFDAARLLFREPEVEIGKALFLNGTGSPKAGGRCTVCHGNGGALATNGQNRNFNTNVEDRPNPARTVMNFPIDGGFGLTPNPDGSFGNRTFNTPSLVEAADTPPFFHNNVVGTLEAAVAFYTGPEFNNLNRPPAARFSFTTTQITQVANFLRALNTLQNIDIARREINELLGLDLASEAELKGRLTNAFNETGDVIQVLSEANIFPLAFVQVTTARQLISQALAASTPEQRLQLIILTGTTLDAARGLVATVL